MEYTTALLIEVLVNLRVEVRADVWRLAPAFSHTAVLAVGVVLVAVWASTLLILSRVDHAFVNCFETAKKTV